MQDRELAQQAVDRSAVLTRLAAYTPTVVSTIFVGLDTSESDIDIICYCVNAERFLETVQTVYGRAPGFRICKSRDPVVIEFMVAGFHFEIYACDTPITEQSAYRHYRIMERLVAAGGSPFQNAVRLLKLEGYKTEPAIARLLNLPGDPWQAILSVERWSDARLQQALTQFD
jgi:hypothetical protein